MYCIALPSLKGRRPTTCRKNIQAPSCVWCSANLIPSFWRCCHFHGQYCRAKTLGLTHRRVGQVHCWHVAIMRQDQTIPPKTNINLANRVLGHIIQVAWWLHNASLCSHQAQRKELFIQERYGRYNLSDPFLALQRDTEAVGGQNKDPGCSSPTSNPLVVLKLVVSHCRRMQEKMLAQLAAAESRHRRVGGIVSLLVRGGRNELFFLCRLKKLWYIKDKSWPQWWKMFQKHKLWFFSP